LTRSFAKYSLFRDAQNSVLGPEGQKMQAEVWGEVIGILEEKVPEVNEIVHHTVA
jgi:hypothetical protein